MSDKLQEISDTLGEGFHTMFRKGCDSKEAWAAWQAIQKIPDKDWSRGMAWLRYCWGLPKPTGEQEDGE